MDWRQANFPPSHETRRQDGWDPWNFFARYFPVLLISLPVVFFFFVSLFLFSSLTSLLYSHILLTIEPLQPHHHNTVLQHICLFAACARPRTSAPINSHLHLHAPETSAPTRLDKRLATCSNPPPNMVEKLYVTYNDVCILCTP